jgi:hypothetical protein
MYESPTGKKKISMLDAMADMLLSIMSAIAASRVYPIDRVDSINVGAYGGIGIVFIKANLTYHKNSQKDYICNTKKCKEILSNVQLVNII